MPVFNAFADPGDDLPSLLAPIENSPRFSFVGYSKRSWQWEKKMGLTGAPSLQRRLGGFPRNRKTKVEQVQKELLWQRPSIHVWPGWKLV